MPPHGEKAFSRFMRVAFNSQEGTDDHGMEGDAVSISTTFVEGSDRAVLFISFAGSPVASCLVTRQDLLDLKKEFDMLAKVKAGRRPLSKQQVRQVKRLARAYVDGSPRP